MKKFALLLVCLLMAGTASAAQQVIMETSLGSIKLELNDEKAPISVENFLSYIDKGFYDDTVFHRVIKGFVIQGGGFTADMKPKETAPPIRNEADNGLKNDRGTIAMARTFALDSATSQFFINLQNNSRLDNRGPRVSDFGYAVFGKVIEGMEVVDKIAGVATGNKESFQDVPKEPVVIKSIKRVKLQDK